MSSKDKQIVKSDKSKDKKKKPLKLNKKDTTTLPPTNNEYNNLLLEQLVELCDKERKTNYENDPQVQTLNYNINNNNNIGNYYKNDYSMQHKQYENYHNVNKNNNQFRTNKFMTDQTTYQQLQYEEQQYYQGPQYQDQQYSLSYSQPFYKTQQFNQQAGLDYRYKRIKEQVNQSLLLKRLEILESVQKVIAGATLQININKNQIDINYNEHFAESILIINQLILIVIKINMIQEFNLIVNKLYMKNISVVEHTFIVKIDNLSQSQIQIEENKV